MGRGEGLQRPLPQWRPPPARALYPPPRGGRWGPLSLARAPGEVQGRREGLGREKAGVAGAPRGGQGEGGKGAGPGLSNALGRRGRGGGAGRKTCTAPTCAAASSRWRARPAAELPPTYWYFLPAFSGMVECFHPFLSGAGLEATVSPRMKYYCSLASASGLGFEDGEDAFSHH